MSGNENSGRKTDGEIIRKYVDTEMANRIANRELLRIDKSEAAESEDLKIVVMPIVLKGMVEKKDINLTLPEPLLGGLSNGLLNNDSNEQTPETPQEN